MGNQTCKGKVEATFPLREGFLVELVFGKETDNDRKFFFPKKILRGKLGGDHPIRRGMFLKVSYSLQKDVNRVEEYSIYPNISSHTFH